LSEITFYGGDAKTAEELSQQVSIATPCNHKAELLQALKLFRELEHLTNIGLTLFLLAKIAAFNNNRRADALFEEAGVFLEQAGAHRLACIAISGKGDCAFARSDFYTARDLYIKTINALEKFGFLHSVVAGYAQMSVGMAAAYLYDYSEANHWLAEAKRTFEKTSTVAHGQIHCDITYGTISFHCRRRTHILTKGTSLSMRQSLEKR
jgi:tetratricopeptide (TPR) repeat protein